MSQLTNEALIKKTIQLGLGKLTSSGSLAVVTGVNTGRSTKERYVVDDEISHNQIAWGKNNQPLKKELADSIFSKVIKRILKTDLFESNGYISNFPVQVLTKSPWHALFANTMFRQTSVERAEDLHRAIRIYHDPFGKLSDYGIDFTSEKIILLDTTEKRVLIVGTAYAGEIKKSGFAMANFLLPQNGIFTMHASANCLTDGSNSSILFGLSGTGKTTLSATPERSLIGDDEIAWDSSGLSNLEGGCYAKLIDLNASQEPLIYAAVQRPGSIQENVVLDANHDVDYHNKSLTENTRGSYPIDYLKNAYPQNKIASQPKSIVFLIADAFGALPAAAKLNSFQAQYHFISGYTAKVAGTELGVTEPQAVFSSCFGAPFMPRPASVYAKMLAEQSAKYGVDVWILNTGWYGGGYKTGKRFPIAVSRAILKAIQNGDFKSASFKKDPVFGFEVPTQCEGVDSSFFHVDEAKSKELAKMFIHNAESLTPPMPAEIVEKGGPKI